MDNQEITPHLTGQYARNPIVRNYLYKLAERKSPINTDKWYHLDTDTLSVELASFFVQMCFDAETEDFMENCYDKSDQVFTQMYHNAMRFVLGFFLSMTSVNGFLHRGSMFVASHAQFLQLLNLPKTFHMDRWIDLGAGDGRTTQALVSHFSECYATEQSPTMRWRLQEKGFTLLDIDKWQSSSFSPSTSSTTLSSPTTSPSSSSPTSPSVVSLSSSDNKYNLITALNLLDRINEPRQLLYDIRDSLHPDGIALLAVVFPFEPIYESGVRFGPPEQILDVRGSTIEHQVNSFVEHSLLPAGFRVERFTRLPYLCEGDLHKDYFRLSDIVFTLTLDTPTQGTNEASSC